MQAGLFVAAEGFLHRRLRRFVAGRRHADFIGNLARKVEQVILAMDRFVRYPGFVEHAAELRADPRVRSFPKRAKRVVIRIASLASLARAMSPAVSKKRVQ